MTRPVTLTTTTRLPGVGAFLTALSLTIATLMLIELRGFGVWSLHGTIVVGSVCLTMLGVAAALIFKGPESLDRALANSQIGVWMCLSFAVTFGLASLEWLSPQTA